MVDKEADPTLHRATRPPDTEGRPPAETLAKYRDNASAQPGSDAKPLAAGRPPALPDPVDAATLVTARPAPTRESVDAATLVTARPAATRESADAATLATARPTPTRDSADPATLAAARLAVTQDPADAATLATARSRWDTNTLIAAQPADTQTVASERAAGVPSGSPAFAAAARSTQPTAFGVGHLLRERYALLELIGQGAMGQVWKARDTYIEQAGNRSPFVAIKVFRADFQNHPLAFEAMEREASRAMQLGHPNIVTVHIFDKDDRSGRCFIVMELLEGRPLDKVIRESGGLAPQKAWPIIRGMSEGLAYAHRRGFVHSDFKPANVFLTAKNVAKVLDFGIARAVRVPELASHDAEDTQDDSVFSGYTAMYAAPEALAEEAPDTADDVFSLGLVAYELLTGRHPFNRQTATEARAKSLRPPPVKGLTRRERRSLEKALALRRAERFANAAAFLKSLQGLSRLQVALVVAVPLLSLLAGGLWYRTYLDSRPAVALRDLPAADQQAVAAALADGNQALHLVKDEHIIEAAEDAANAFWKAYERHPKDPDAVAGLDATAQAVIDWAHSQPDKQAALAVLRGLQAKSDYYNHYRPLTRAVEKLQGR